ncbi:MAG: ABC transporter substrate-binding protein [Acidilobus sp.]
MERRDYLTTVLAILVIMAVGLAVYNSFQLSQLRDYISRFGENLSTVKSTAQQSINYVKELSQEAQQLGSALAQVNSSLSSQVISIRSQLSLLEAQQGFPTIIVDALNRTVVVPVKPIRIIALDPAAAEIVLAIGATSQLVGIDNDSLLYLPPPYNYTIHELYANGSLEVIGSTYTSPSIEEILSLSPDLVIGTAGWGYNNYIATTLAQYGVPVILLPSSQSLEDVYRSIIMAGQATGHVRQAVQLVENMSASVSLTERAASGFPRVNVTVVLWINPTYVAGGGTFISDMLTLAGGINVFENLTGWPVVSPEEMLQANPGVVIIMSNGGLFNITSFYQWLNSTIGPSYLQISAVKNGRVYVIKGWYEDVISEPAVLTPLGLKLLVAILHPQAFNLTQIPQVISPATLPLGGG